MGEFTVVNPGGLVGCLRVSVAGGDVAVATLAAALRRLELDFRKAPPLADCDKVGDGCCCCTC